MKSAAVKNKYFFIDNILQILYLVPFIPPRHAVLCEDYIGCRCIIFSSHGRSAA